MRVVLMLLCAVVAFGQQLTTVSSRTTGRPGDTGVITIALAGQTTPQVAALQFTEDSTGLTVQVPVVAGVAQAAGKIAQCSTQAARICLLYGVNVTVMENGTVLTVGFTIPSGAAGGLVRYKITGLVAADGAGGNVPITAPADLVITVLSRFDLTGDGKVDVADINRVVSQIIGNTPVTDCDVNGDTKCDVRDVQMVVANLTPP